MWEKGKGFWDYKVESEFRKFCIKSEGTSNTNDLKSNSNAINVRANNINKDIYLSLSSHEGKKVKDEFHTSNCNLWLSS